MFEVCLCGYRFQRKTNKIFLALPFLTDNCHLLDLEIIFEASFFVINVSNTSIRGCLWYFIGHISHISYLIVCAIISIAFYSLTSCHQFTSNMLSWCVKLERYCTFIALANISKTYTLFKSDKNLLGLVLEKGPQEVFWPRSCGSTMEEPIQRRVIRDGQGDLTVSCGVSRSSGSAGPTMLCISIDVLDKYVSNAHRFNSSM